MQFGRVLVATRYAVRLLAGLGAVSVAGFVSAQAGLWEDRGGLGLRLPQGGLAASPSTPPAQHQTPSSSQDYRLYSGVRELPRLGTSSPESYSGLVYTLSRRWGSSLEAGVTPESASGPRRYSLAGALGTALAGDRAVSVGLKYRHYDTASGFRGGPYGDGLGNIGNAYLSAPSIVSGLDSSYEVRLRYQHSRSSSFGLTLGRDLETMTPGLDTPANGERQLMFTGQHWLTPSWGLTYDLLSDEPGSSMRVQGLRLGVRYRF